MTDQNFEATSREEEGEYRTALEDALVITFSDDQSLEEEEEEEKGGTEGNADLPQPETNRTESVEDENSEGGQDGGNVEGSTRLEEEEALSITEEEVTVISDDVKVGQSNFSLEKINDDNDDDIEMNGTNEDLMKRMEFNRLDELDSTLLAENGSDGNQTIILNESKTESPRYEIEEVNDDPVEISIREDGRMENEGTKDAPGSSIEDSITEAPIEDAPCNPSPAPSSTKSLKAFKSSLTSLVSRRKYHVHTDGASSPNKPNAKKSAFCTIQ